MILEVDMGNSRLKWRLRNGFEEVASGSVDNKHAGAYSQVFEPIASLRPQKVVVASVLSAPMEGFSLWCRQKWSLEPVYAEVTKSYAGVTNGYHDVSQMGVDRWLAVLAAYNDSENTRKRACLVISSGTACTVDLVLSNGIHLGGYITPGLQLMKDALFRDTDRVKLDSIGYDGELRAGKSTHMAVSSGLRLMHLGLVDIALNEIIEEGASAPYVVFTGGGGNELAQLFEKQLVSKGFLGQVGDIVVRPMIVLDGLSVLFGSNGL